jgi:transposase-like protein
VARKKPSPRPKRAAKRPRRRYSTAVKARILKVAVAESLTARQVQAKFGVKPVTYYSWRKAAKPASGRAVGQAGRGRPEATRLAGLVRESVQERLRGMLPKIVGAEVERYLSQAFSRSARSRSR